MTTTHLTELRFGRNIKGTPMGSDDWAVFQQSARGILEAYGTRVAGASWVEVHTGTGTWTDEDGTVVVEESAVATLYSEGPLFGPAVSELFELVAGHAAIFEQDAIAVVLGGTSHLIKAEVSA